MPTLLPPLTGVALGWRPELAADLLRQPGSVDFLEVVAETCFAGKAAWREARALAEMAPLVPHGVKLSLGSAEGIEEGRAQRLGALARDLRARAVSEHVAFTRAGGRELGHLTALPCTREAVRVVARNVAAARRRLPDVPLLLENVAWTFRWPEDEMEEGDFYAEVAAATGCPLLLDLGNLYANALNAGRDPLASLQRHPLDRAAMVHVAGGVMEHGFFLDTHAHPVPEEVFALLEALLEATGPLPVVLERDQDFPDFEVLAAEVARLRARVRAAGDEAAPKAPAAAPASLDPGLRPAAALTDRQSRMAALLTDVAPPPAGEAAPFGPGALVRARAVLQRKRVDDALPLLPHTSAAGERAREVGRRALQGTPRAPRGAGIVDALRIAEAALDEADLRAGALRDRLLLEARFAARGKGNAQGRAPRQGPYLGRQRLPGGRSMWALKGPGLDAPVRVLERGGRS